jgi:hypothetical protein
MTAARNSHLILCSSTKTEVCTFDCTNRNDMETDIPICANMKYGYLSSDSYLQWHMINSSIYCVIIGTTLTV